MTGVTGMTPPGEDGLDHFYNYFRDFRLLVRAVTAFGGM